MARLVLEEVANQTCASGGQYRAVRMGGKNAFVLGSEGSVFSIIKDEESNDALNSMIAAHEKSLADQRELSSSSDGMAELLHIFDIVTDMCEGGGAISPAPEVLDNGKIRRTARARGGTSGEAAKSLSNGKGSASSKVTKKKETTAAAFFAQKDSKKKSEKKTAATNTSKGGGKENNKKPAAAPSTTKATTKPESKSTKNVDDFQGDEDEDEEFLAEDRERKARNAREARKEVRSQVVDVNAKKRNLGSLSERRVSNPEKRKKADEKQSDDEEMKQESEDEIEGEEVKRGVMDAFAIKNATSGGEGAKKLKKKLVEKTVMENGYLKTVTEEVWEEVEDDETKSQPQPVAKAKSAPVTAKSKIAAKGKKQGNLTGFFKKK
jgi:hypothetical protein